MESLCDFVEALIRLSERQAPAKPVYVDSDMNSNFETPAESWLSIFLVMKGSLDFDVGGCRRLAKAGELVGLNAHFGNVGLMHRRPVLYACLSLDVTGQAEADRFGLEPVLLCEQVCDPVYLHGLCRKLCRLTHMPPAHFPEIQVHTVLQQALVAMYEAIPPEDESLPPGRGRIVREAMRMIQEHHADPGLSLERIAQAVGVSVGHLEKQFRAEMASTPMQVLGELRMARARALLSGTPSAVKDVSAAVGFRDPLYFSRAFRRAAGVSPRQYRTRQGVQHETNQ